MHDPGIGFVTITRVKVSPDLQLARVYYTIARRRTGEKRHARARWSARNHSCAGRSAAGCACGGCPSSTFEFDLSVEHQDRVEQLLLEIANERKAAWRGARTTGLGSGDKKDESDGHS